MNTYKIFFMAMIGSLKSYVESQISNGAISGTSNIVVVSTTVQEIRDPFRPNMKLGYQCLYLVVDRISKTTYPFIAVESTIDGVNAIIENTKNSLFANSSSVMNIDKSPKLIISRNSLTNNMITEVTNLTKKKLVEVFGEINNEFESYMSNIFTDAYREIQTLISSYGLNPSNLYQATFQDPNTGLILMNGQFMFPSDLIATINNLGYTPDGQFNYSIYFTLSYSLQRIAKNDLLHY